MIAAPVGAEDISGRAGALRFLAVCRARRPGARPSIIDEAATSLRRL